MTKWIKSKKTGVRWREHPTRKHGVSKDRYFVLFYKADGKTVSEGLGWASQGWNEDKASGIWAELKENRRRSEGPRTLAEKNDIKEVKRQKETEQEEQEARDRLTFSEYALGGYKACKEIEEPKAWIRDEQVLRLWINPVIGSIPLKDIAPFHIKKIKAVMIKAGRTPHTIHYVRGVVRQVFNYALEDKKFSGLNPARKTFKKSKKKEKLPDNERRRFLTRDEAASLLAELATKSPDVHDMALISLHTGLRAGEIFKLTWADVDINRGILTLLDTKNTKSRNAFMTEAVKEIFRTKERGAPSDFVFHARKGKKIKQISLTFARAVDTLKLNEGIEDRRHQVTFHTLRHTYASWHVENGTDLYAVKELLGHSDIRMTQRYSHLGENTLQAAVKRLDSTLQAPVKVVALVKRGDE